MSRITLAIFACLCFIHARPGVYAQEPPANTLPSPIPRCPVAEPEDLRSHNGVLQVDLTVHNFTQPDGTTRFCYFDANGNQSPTLRLSPGDLLILNLKNDLTDSPSAAPPTAKSPITITPPQKKNAEPMRELDSCR